ncbi:MAG: DUF2225 domain-containing protein [Planctomycetales bacterium]|nr:DUF2225 domain-containing protein [bacterium]UNM08495.1 MAG: DUF2225 domain-containing protein [Planctomycetales bacterium]
MHRVTTVADSRLKLPSEYYVKEYTCPVSELPFQAVVVKSRAYSLEGRDPDFRPHYKGVNPLHYAIIVSPFGFAAEEPQYKRNHSVLFRDREGLAAKLSGGLREDFSGLRTVQQAARSYEMAVAVNECLRVPQYEIAGLALRGSWLNLEWHELEANPSALSRAKVLRRIALEKYMHAFQKEDVSKLKLGSHGVALIVAELLREQGRFEESLQWFMRLVSDRACSSEILRNARNQMDLCKEQRKEHGGDLEASPSGVPVAAPGPARSLDRSSLSLYRDQRKWLEGSLAESKLDEGSVCRALLDALKESGRDVSGFASEDALRHWATGKLKA